MNNLPAFKRQIEMLSIFYPYNKIRDCSVLDLAEKYRVAKVTIDRDMKDLRSMGIPINCVYGKGIEITGKVNQKIIAELIVKYIAMYHSDIIVQNTLFNAVNENNISHVFIFSNLNDAVENKNIVLLKYKLSEESVLDVLVLPCKIIHNINELEFIGVHDNTVEIFKFNNILSLKITSERNMTNYDSKINEFLKQTTNSSSAKIFLKLQFENNSTIDKFNINNFVVTKKLDDNVIEAEISHNSLDNLAKWVIEQYGKVKVLEPKELRDRIIDIAQYTLKLYTEEPPIEELHKKLDLPKRRTSKSENDKSDNIKPQKESSLKLKEKEDKIEKKSREIKSAKYLKVKKPVDMADSVEHNFDKNGYMALHSHAGTWDNQLQEGSIYDFIEVELPIESLNDYSVEKPSFLKRIFNWVIQK
ncbi:MAG: WYL domain-containing transcriptional regulator [Ignavibacteriae bacterium]|nr:WYL domain-containing transcriptional regulator [Ignavibacteriota bacterium]